MKEDGADLANRYENFLRERLATFSDRLKTTLQNFVDTNISGEVVSIEFAVRLDGLDYEFPVYVFCWSRDGGQLEDECCKVINEDFEKIGLILQPEERDCFLIWEAYGDGSDKQVAIDQPADGIEEKLFFSWFISIWQQLDKRRYKTKTRLGFPFDPEGQKEIWP